LDSIWQYHRDDPLMRISFRFHQRISVHVLSIRGGQITSRDALVTVNPLTVHARRVLLEAVDST